MASPTAPTPPPTAQRLAQAPGRAAQPLQSSMPPQTTQATARRDVSRRMATMAQLRTLKRVNYQVSFIYFVNKIRYATFCANKDAKNPHWAINKHIMDVCWLQTVNALFNKFSKRNSARSKARLIKAVAQVRFSLSSAGGQLSNRILFAERRCRSQRSSETPQVLG